MGILSRLLPSISQELKGSILEKAEIDTVQSNNVEVIKISCKTFSDPLRKSQRFQPIIVKLHKDFATSEFAQHSFIEISKKFTTFIRNKCTEFIPRTTDNPNEAHTPDYWIFPADSKSM